MGILSTFTLPIFLTGMDPKSGVPTERMWTNVCRNFDKLQELKKRHFNIVDCNQKSKSPGYRNRELGREIDEWRYCLRKSRFLSKEEFVSIDGKQLDEQLKEFTKLSKIKRYYTITKNILREEIPKNDQLLHPVYITPEERAKQNDIRKKTKETLREYISEYMSKISCVYSKEYYESLYEDLKDNHNSLVVFLLELKEFVSQID